MGGDQTSGLMYCSHGARSDHCHEEHDVWQVLEPEGDDVKGHRLLRIFLGMQICQTHDQSLEEHETVEQEARESLLRRTRISMRLLNKINSTKLIKVCREPKPPHQY